MRNSLLAILPAFAIFSLSAGHVSADESPPPSPAPAAANNATITVDVGTFRNTKGALGCRLFSSGAGFPQSGNVFAQQRAAISGTSARCTFTNVPPGTYAVSVLHDENLNNKLDTNFIGAPTEGYGVSNNRTYALSAPKWDESKFTIEKSKDLRLAISLRY